VSAPTPAPAEEKKSELDQLLESEPEAAEVKPEPLEEPSMSAENATEIAPLSEEKAESESVLKDE
jgi:hypothetical protein